MSKARVAPVLSTPQAADAPRTVPLNDITITWPYVATYGADPEPVTIRGADLAPLLDVAARRSRHTKVEDQLDETAGVARRLSGLTHVMRSIAQSDWWETEDVEPMMTALADFVETLQLRITSDPIERRFAEATVTIGAPAKAEAA